MRAAIELGHPGIDLLADGKAIRTLLGTVAGEFRTLDEGREFGADDLHVDATFLHVDHFAGDDGTLLQLAASRFGAGAGTGAAVGGCTGLGEVLDAERDALLLDVDIEHLGRNLIALLVLFDDLLARTFPIQIGQMHHAVDIAVEPEKQAEFGLVLDLALNHRAGGIFLEKHLPRIAHGLFEAERNTALHRIDFENLHFDLPGGRYDLAGMHVLFGPRHFGNVDQAFDAGFEFDEGTIVGDVGDAALEPGADRIL